MCIPRSGGVPEEFAWGRRMTEMGVAGARAERVAALGRRIRDERTARGLSLQELALRTGLTAPTLSALERGDEHASLGALFAAAEALDVPPGSLFSAAPTAAASVPPAHPAPAPVATAPRLPHATPRPTGPAPRTFADLRVGVLADRTFATLAEFAVAAVVEAGHPLHVIASIFRVPSWRLQEWIDNGVSTPPAPKQAQRTAWGR